MSGLALGGLISSGAASTLGALLQFIAQMYSADYNAKSVKDTNASNLNIARETNAANVEQAELAYQRSLPTNQVANMMQAGMSKYAALSTLQGGGSYTAPTLQSAHMDAPQKNLDFNAIADRLQNIPANVEQLRMVKEQVHAISEDQRRRDEELRMATERHNQEMEFRRNEELRKQYGQNIVEMTDKLRSRVDNLIDEKHVDRNSLTTLENLVKSLELDKDPYWRNAPASARDSVFEYVKGIASEDRANRAAKDTHDIARQNLNDLKLRIEDYKNEKNAREKEYKLRELRADFESLALDYDLSIAQLRRDFYIDKDGKPKLHTERSQNAKEFWNMVVKVIPIETLGDIFRGVLSVSK